MKKAKPFDAFEPEGREPGERDPLDRVAWLLFAAGILGMVFVAIRALASESDGDFRTWDEIRWQVKQLWGAGFLAAGGPLIIWFIRRGLKRPIEDDPPT